MPHKPGNQPAKPRDCGQRKPGNKPNPLRPIPPKSPKSLSITFSGQYRHTPPVIRRQPSGNRLTPKSSRPVFARTATAGMNQNCGFLLRPGKNPTGFLQIRLGRINPGSRIVQKERELLQRTRQLINHMLLIRKLRRPDHDILLPTTGKIFLKNPVGIKEIANDLIEGGEIIDQFGREFRLPREESGKGTVFNRAGGLRIITPHSQFHNVPIAQKFDTSLRQSLAQQPQSGQGQHKIANRPAPYNQNTPRHRRWIAVTAWWAYCPPTHQAPPISPGDSTECCSRRADRSARIGRKSNTRSPEPEESRPERGATNARTQEKNRIIRRCRRKSHCRRAGSQVRGEWNSPQCRRSMSKAQPR